MADGCVTVTLSPQEFAILRRALSLAIDDKEIDWRAGLERIRELDRLRRREELRTENP